MFGDIMHGIWLLVFSSWLCWTDRSKSGTLANALAPIRYLFLLMGVFSTFMGFIYNDFSSLSTQIFAESCFDKVEVGKNGQTFLHRSDSNCVYPFGIDPVWFRSYQEISFLNSFKMKISVIYAVAQMSMGTVMKVSNALYHRDWIKLFTEALTQLVLIYVLFGLMDAFIIVKWLTDWTGKNAPGVINTMIVMFINGGVKPKDDLSDDILSDQKKVMNICVMAAAICIPPMLLGVPCLGLKGHKTHDTDYESAENLRIQEVRELAKNSLSPQEDHSFQGVFIHQMIETIEYVLGTVSNTASYLRLWALSLAHSQLAKVFFDYTMKPALLSRSYVMVSSFIFDKLIGICV